MTTSVDEYSAPGFAIETATDPALAPAVAEVAAATFPLACPPDSRPDDIAVFIRENLGPANFAAYIASPESEVLVARAADGTLAGYALVHHRAPADADVAAVITERPTSEISKMYVLPDHHAHIRPSETRTAPPSHLLMRAAIDRARLRGSAVVWLGVNQENERAQRFYAKMGFHRAGAKTFDLNGNIEHDYVLSQPLT
ncbi:GNAT family N-acetyltransferase [Gordonia sp. NPDC003376]